MVKTTGKIHSSERAMIVAEFINEVGCTEGSANVYFTQILQAQQEEERNGIPTKNTHSVTIANSETQNSAFSKIVDRMRASDNTSDMFASIESALQ